MSRASEIAARVAACRAKAQMVMSELNSLVGELPEWREPAVGEESALMNVRVELEEAIGYLKPALDYLTPRGGDDADPDCCAHRRLQAFIASREARS